MNGLERALKFRTKQGPGSNGWTLLGIAKARSQEQPPELHCQCALGNWSLSHLVYSPQPKLFVLSLQNHFHCGQQGAGSADKS